MANETINEKQIIDFLKQREQLLREELKKIEATINVIESSNRVLSSQAVSADIPNPADDDIETEKRKPGTKKLTSVNTFRNNGKLDEKISYVLTKFKSAFKEDILEELLERQPDEDMLKLQNALGVRLSYLLKNNLIDAEKHGRKFKYKLL